VNDILPANCRRKVRVLQRRVQKRQARRTKNRPLQRPPRAVPQRPIFRRIHDTGFEQRIRQKRGVKVGSWFEPICGWIKCRAQSFAHAGRGILLLWRTQWNFRIHLVAGLVAICLGGYFRILPIEWLALIVAIGLVLCAEALNTAIERMVDRIEPQRHPAARDAKDLAAAGVLIASACSLMVGVMVFGPRLVRLLLRYFF